jgi:hypothetical protein
MCGRDVGDERMGAVLGLRRSTPLDARVDLHGL